jgi:hypothetical protein
MRAVFINSAWFSRILSTTPRSTLNSVALTREIPFEIDGSIAGGPPGGIATGGGFAATGGGALAGRSSSTWQN